MTIQNSILFDPSISDVMKNMVFLPCPEASVRFADTCKEAHKIVSQFWEQQGFLRKEMKYCILSPLRMQENISPEFDYLASKLPRLLSAEGVTYKDKDGSLKNAKCVYNWKSGELCLRVISKSRVEVFILTKGNCFNNKTGYYSSLFDWYTFSNPCPTVNREIWDSCDKKNGSSYFSELADAVPLKTDEIIFPNINKIEADFCLHNIFNRENKAVQAQLDLI